MDTAVLFTPKQAAKRLGIPAKALQRLRQAGHIGGIKVTELTTIYTEEHLVEAGIYLVNAREETHAQITIQQALTRNTKKALLRAHAAKSAQEHEDARGWASQPWREY